MAIVKFETDRENDLIRIPEQYINQIPIRVSVTLDDVEKPRLRSEMLTDEFFRLTEEAKVEEQLLSVFIYMHSVNAISGFAPLALPA